MKKSYYLREIDCPVCAGKIEAGIQKIKGVIAVNVNFLAESMTLEAEEADFDRVFKEALAVCKKIEPDCEVSPK